MQTVHEQKIMPMGAKALTRAIEILRGGGRVAVPTETVYGLAADATNGQAVAGIFAAKGRPQFNPLICHVSSIEMAQSFAVVSHEALALMEAFWPGPLTLVLPLKSGSQIHPLVTAGLDSVGVRCPQGFAAELIAEFGKPLAAPSANASGKISPTTANAVAHSLGDKAELIIDGGACAVGLESTIVKVEDDQLTLLRSGSITLSDFEKVSHLNLLSAKADAPIQAPGMLKSHYAPDAAMRLNVVELQASEALLAFGQQRPEGAGDASAMLNLSPSGNLIEAAANLFSMMSELDQTGATCIAVEPIPMEGIGIAINDRLMRAAAPRGDTYE